MSDQAALRNAAREALVTAGQAPKRAYVGLDGAQDIIVRVVDKRHDFEHYDRIRTIEEFSRRIAAAAGRSTNFEWVIQQIKLGGNGGLMAMALGRLGVGLYFVGALGWPDIDPIFNPLREYGELVTCAGMNVTNAAEFDDGKIMLGRPDIYKDLRWDRFVDCAGGEAKLAEKLAGCELVAMTNWTMVPFSNEVYENMTRVIRENATGELPMLFFDLADPAKRPVEDLHGVVELLSGFAGEGFHVIFGLNHNEAIQVAEALGVEAYESPEPGPLTALARSIREKTGVTEIVIHPRARAAAATAEGAWCAEGPFTPNPKLSTGAGDHFNGGYCYGRLHGLAPQLALVSGVATSGFYVRNAQGPTHEDLLEFIGSWGTGDNAKN